ncbi:phenylacetate--CoA ligase family protein [Candidatus Roizmanbacteria bacterium]|nr:phenylacetate--CoA ligase family protein [Candidatus Roizmanbacteria bacterium]
MKNTTCNKTYLNEIQMKRLKEIVNYARVHSEYYKKLYENVPVDFDSIEELPTTNKSVLMSHFDDWVTDKAIKLSELSKFIADTSLIGKMFLEKYHVAITSGTTGKSGIFVTNEQETKLSAKINKRSKFSWLGVLGIVKLFLRGIRIAAITATGEHYGFISGIVFMKSENKFWKKRIKAISIHEPISTIVKELNSFQPTILMGYASMISLLASEQAAKRLRISPLLIEVMSEKLTDDEFERVGKVFKVKPYQMYGATEIPFASPLCKYGWYHMNTDLVIMEPVDNKGEPVPDGILSHTLLITNLANKTQPMIRYDIGDCIMLNPDRCKCGSPNPAFKVQGRSADVIIFINKLGDKVVVPSLMFITLIDKCVQGIEAFQIIQTAPLTLEIRLQYSTEFDDKTKKQQWDVVVDELTKLFKDRGLYGIGLVRSLEPPQRAKGGKLRMVIPYDKIR